MEGEYRGESDSNCCSGLTRRGRWKVNVEVSLS